MSMAWWWLSSRKMTVAVETDNGDVIRTTPPIVRKFQGQPLRNLTRWMQTHGSYRQQQLR